MGWLAALFFVSFVIIGGLVLFSLFIGIICTNMDTVQAETEQVNLPPCPVQKITELFLGARMWWHNMWSTRVDSSGLYPRTQAAMTEKNTRALSKILGIPVESIHTFEEIFKFLDKDKQGCLDFESVRSIFE